MMTFGSVCSGIEAASVAWHGMGWRAAWLAEIEPFPSAVLAHHYPDVPNLGDMTTIADKVLSGDVAAPDVLVGGTPCQAFSIAGLRQSLDDSRGQLSLEFVRLANAIDSKRSIHGKQPAIIVWENVCGVLSTKDDAFGCFLAGLAGESSALQPAGGKWTNAGCVFGPQRAVAWRVLDAQYFGVAQRRRRVFVVASARNGFNPSEILFEFDGVRRDIAPSRKTGQETAGNAGCGIKAAVPFNRQRSDEYSDQDIASTCTARDYKDATDLVVAFPTKLSAHYAYAGAKQQNYICESSDCLNPDQPQCWRVYHPDGVAPALQSGEGRGNAVYVPNYICERPVAYGISESPYVAHCLRAGASKADKHESTTYVIQAGNGFDASGVCYTLTATDRHGVAITIASKQQAMTCEDNLASTLGANDYKEPQAVCVPMAVRRLMPVECERLQGFPDGYTCIPYRKKTADLCPDSPRYKALGNSMAVPCMAWIGKRIADYVGMQP